MEERKGKDLASFSELPDTGIVEHITDSKKRIVQISISC